MASRKHRYGFAAKPDYTCGFQRKEVDFSSSADELVRAFQSSFEEQYRENAALFAAFQRICGDFLCLEDCLAERGGFEPPIELLTL